MVSEERERDRVNETDRQRLRRKEGGREGDEQYLGGAQVYSNFYHLV